METRAGGLDEGQLLRHAAWMRRLAARLVDDGADADDVAQEALLVALERPPRHTLGLRAWFGQVVRNAARRLGRAEGRRSRREARAARPEALPSASELAAEAEVQQALVAALFALEEPYRSTLVLRFYRGLEPAEIARLEGVPAGTVRSRVARGVELLRARLDARSGGRAAWVAALARLKGGKHVAAASTAALGGGIAMGLKLALACAAATAAAALLLVPRGLEERPGEALADARAAPSPGDGARSRSSSPAPAPEALQPAVGVGQRIALVPEIGRGRVARMIARDRRGGEAMAGVSLALSAGGWDHPVFARAVTGADGRAEVELPPDVGDWVRVEWSGEGVRAGWTDVEDFSSEVELSAEWFTVLTGIVRDAQTGEPLADVTVSGWSASVTDGDGRYRLAEEKVGERGEIAASKPGYVPLQTTFLVREPGEALLDLSLERGFELELSCFDRDTGLPLADVEVGHGAKPLASSDVEGRAKLVVDGGWIGLFARKDGYCALYGTWMLQAPPEAPVRVPMIRVAWLAGRVADERDQPVQGAFVMADCPRHPTGWVVVAEEDLLGPGARKLSYQPPAVGAKSDERGRYRMAVLDCGHPRTVRAGKADFQSTAVEVPRIPPPGDTLQVDLKGAHAGRVRGTVTVNAIPLDGVVIACRGSDGELGISTSSDAEGRYSLERIAPGETTLAVVLDGDLLAEASVAIEGGQALEHDFRIEAELSEIRGRVTQGGAGLPGASVSVQTKSPEDPRDFWHAAITDAEGAYRVVVRPGKTHEVCLNRKPAPLSHRDVPSGAAGVDFDLPARGTLRLRLVDPEQRALELGYGGSLLWRADEGSWAPGACDPDLGGRLELEVDSGSVDVLMNVPGYAPKRAYGVRVPAGGASDVAEMVLARAFDAPLSFQGSGVSPSDLQGHLLFLLEEQDLAGVEGPFRPDGGGNLQIDELHLRLALPTLTGQIIHVDGSGAAVAYGFGPGRYHLRVFPDDFAFEPEAIDLPAPGKGPLEVRWRRR